MKGHCRQVGDKAERGAGCLSLAVDKRHFAAVGCVKCYFASKCVGLALVQSAICRFHRRGSATWVKVLDIGCSICVLRNKSAVKFRFRLKRGKN